MNTLLRPDALAIHQYLLSIADADGVARPSMVNLEMGGFSKREVVRGTLDLHKAGVISVHRSGRFLDEIDGYRVKAGSLGQYVRR